MALSDATDAEKNRFWREHNEDRTVLGDHGHRLKTVENRVDRLEAHMSEQYGAVLTKLDGVAGEVRSVNERFIEMRSAAREREKLNDKALSMKWPLFVSVVAALIAAGSLIVNAMPK